MEGILNMGQDPVGVSEAPSSVDSRFGEGKTWKQGPALVQRD